MTTQVIANVPNVTTITAMRNRAPRMGLPEPTPGGAAGASQLPWGRSPLPRIIAGARCAVLWGPK